MQPEISTLFYMPHCGKGLYGGVLRANWSYSKLSSLAIIGNGFHAYAEREDTKAKQSCISLVRLYYFAFFLSVNYSQIKPHTVEVALPGQEDEAFNSTSLHLFPTTQIPADQSSFWTLPSRMLEEVDKEVI